MKLETIGKILASGFGDRVAIGILLGFLDNVSPLRAYEYIQTNLKLGYWVSDEDWQKYKKLAKQANIDEVTKDRIIAELREHRPDILSVILNTPKGLEWLDNQISEMKRKLALE